MNISPTAAPGKPTSLTVEENIEIDVSPLEAWNMISDFARLHEWHPAVVESELVAGTNLVPGAVRHLTLGNGATLDEMLTVYEPDHKTLEYVIVAGEFPALDYRSVLAVKPLADPGKSHITWRGFFNRADPAAEPAPDQDDATAIRVVRGVYTSGLQSLRKTIADRKLSNGR